MIRRAALVIVGLLGFFFVVWIVTDWLDRRWMSADTHYERWLTGGRIPERSK